MARACAAQTKSTFLKLAGPQLVQMFIGDGAKLVRDAFALAKEKSPAIIFIDELDAIGTKRFDSEKAGDREVQRTMLELLNQLDGFSSTADIKVIAATNRVDILDPALLRSGKLVLIKVIYSVTIETLIKFKKSILLWNMFLYSASSNSLDNLKLIILHVFVTKWSLKSAPALYRFFELHLEPAVD